MNIRNDEINNVPNREIFWNNLCTSPWKAIFGSSEGRAGAESKVMAAIEAKLQCRTQQHDNKRWTGRLGAEMCFIIMYILCQNQFLSFHVIW